MNISSPRIVIRDRALLDVFDLAARFLVVHRVPFLKLSLALLVPHAVLSACSHFIDPVMGWLYLFVVAPLLEGPYVLLSSRLVFEEKVRVRDAITEGITRLPGQALILLVQGIVTTFAAFFLFVGLLWVGPSTLFLSESYLLERAGIGAAFSRAQRISGADFGDALLTWILLFLGLFASVLLSDWLGRAIIASLFEFRPPASMWDSGGSVLAHLGVWLFLPYKVLARFFVYLNCRTRTEGWDVQTRFLMMRTRLLEATS